VLFTDADVRLEPTTLRRAAAALRDERADLLVLLPEVESDHVVQGALTTLFFQQFLMLARGTHANRDDGRFAIGVGAFNLVRRSAWEEVGGHGPLRLQVGDDVALARLLL